MVVNRAYMAPAARPGARVGASVRSYREARQRGSLLQAHYKIFTMGNSYPLTFSNSKIRHGTKKFSTAVDLHSCKFRRFEQL